MKILYAENLSEYKCWSNMKQRCFNPNSNQFIRYGGLGITVCERWRTNFSAFLEDMGNKPQKGWHIHRKNNDGDYEPENCIWIAPEKHKLIPKRPPQNNIDFTPAKRICRKGLTERQLQILNFIKDQTLTPTVREISDHFNMTAKGAYDHIKALEKKGKITMQPNKARSIVVVSDSE